MNDSTLNEAFASINKKILKRSRDNVKKPSREEVRFSTSAPEGFITSDLNPYGSSGVASGGIAWTTSQHTNFKAKYIDEHETISKERSSSIRNMASSKDFKKVDPCNVRDSVTEDFMYDVKNIV